MDCDLHDVYGINIWDGSLMESLPWPALRSRVVGLLMRDTATARSFMPAPTP